MKAIWNDTILAESEDTKIVEGNHYFPMEDINEKYFRESDSHSRCPWKGKASYFHLEIDEEKTIVDAAWYYPSPSFAAKPIKDHVAFDEEIEVRD